MKNLHPERFHSQLMNKRSQKRPHYVFVNDGILNMPAWEATSPKVMFLLKDTTNDFIQITGKSIDDRDGSSSHFWWNICHWKRAFKSYTLGNYPEFISIKQLTEIEFNDYLMNNIAYVYIKRSNENKNQSIEGYTSNYAVNDRVFW